MQFDFRLGPLFRGDRISCWDAARLRTLSPQHKPQMSAIIDRMGRASTKAQGLSAILTSASKFQFSDNRLYLYAEHDCVVGLLKVGPRNLFVIDRQQRMRETKPLCVLDFYVHESKQRLGIGRKLFEFMLDSENIQPHKLAYDFPSPKLRGFCAKHYGLKSYVSQNNKFVIFDAFWDKKAVSRPPGSPTQPGSNPAVSSSSHTDDTSPPQTSQDPETATTSKPVPSLSRRSSGRSVFSQNAMSQIAGAQSSSHGHHHSQQQQHHYHKRTSSISSVSSSSSSSAGLPKSGTHDSSGVMGALQTSLPHQFSQSSVHEPISSSTSHIRRHSKDRIIPSQPPPSNHAKDPNAHNPSSSHLAHQIHRLQSPPRTHSKQQAHTRFQGYHDSPTSPQRHTNSFSFRDIDRALHNTTTASTTTSSGDKGEAGQATQHRHLPRSRHGSRGTQLSKFNQTAAELNSLRSADSLDALRRSVGTPLEWSGSTPNRWNSGDKITNRTQGGFSASARPAGFNHTLVDKQIEETRERIRRTEANLGKLARPNFAPNTRSRTAIHHRVRSEFHNTNKRGTSGGFQHPLGNRSSLRSSLS